MEPVCFGIDLGTTNSCLASFNTNGKLEVFENTTGDFTTPSVVSIMDDECFVGQAAIDKMSRSPKTTYYCAKRLIGRKFDDPTIQDDLKTFSFDVIGDDKERPVIPFKGTKYVKAHNLFPEHISAIILKYLLTSADKKCNREFRDVVITVPANFNDYQRRATIEAGRIAGFHVLEVLSEPTAAAICYAYNSPKKEGKQNIMVFDFGGGTLDISILEIDNFRFTVRATSGNAHLGGSDIDNRLVRDLIEDIRTKEGINLDDPEHSGYKLILRRTCEQAKIRLTTNNTTNINFELPGGKMYKHVMNTAKFEKMCADLSDSLTAPMNVALESAKMTIDQIDDVVMVGGSSKIPFVQKAIENFAHKKPALVDVAEGIAKGAALYGAFLKKAKIGGIDRIIVTDVTPMAIGIGVNNKRVFQIIPRNTVRPFRSEKTQYKGNKPRQGIKNSIIRIKIFEGDSKLQRECHQVAEYAIEADQYNDDGYPIINLQVDITTECIKVNATSTKSQKVLTVNTKQEAHTKEEFNMIANDVKEFLTNHEDPDEALPVDAFKEYIRKNQVTIKKATAKAHQKELKEFVAENKDWCKKNERATKAQVKAKMKEFIDKVEEWKK